ncbi:hypothetical protein niasHT_013142 [Heterodera trifolii]
MDFGDLAEDDDGSQEYAITAITLYDRTACMLCSRVFAKCGPGNEDFRLFGIMDGERVALDRLFATPVATPDPTPVPSPVVEIEVETTAVVSVDEEDTDEQQQHHHQ